MDKRIEEILNAKLINPNSAEEIWEVLKAAGMEELDDYLKTLNCNMYEIIYSEISKKLSYKEIAQVFDPLNELLQGNIPHFALMIKPEDQIKVQIRYMNENGFCSNLTDEEKLFFAWCVYLMTCTYKIVDGNILYGITEFTSYEKIINLYNEDKNTFPNHFDLSDNRIRKGEYGFDAENPISTTSVAYTYRLIRNLLYKNEKVEIEARGSVRANNTNHNIDYYDLVTSNDLHVRIYVDSYCINNSNLLPEGFSLYE